MPEKPNGRPSCYQWLHPCMVELYEKGYTHKEVAASFNTGVRTVYSWLSRYPDFRAKVREARQRAASLK